MSTGSRIVFINDDDTLQRVSVSKFQKAYLAREKIVFKGCEGKRVRMALAFVEVKGRKSAWINYVEYSIIAFTKLGLIDEEEVMKGLRHAVNSVAAFTEKAKFNPDHLIQDVRHKHLFRWKPSANLEKRIRELILQ